MNNVSKPKVGIQVVTPAVTPAEAPKPPAPVHVSWDIYPPPGATFMATGGMHTTLRFVRGREIEILNWLEGELDRQRHNIRAQYAATHPVNPSAETEPAPPVTIDAIPEPVETSAPDGKTAGLRMTDADGEDILAFVGEQKVPPAAILVVDTKIARMPGPGARIMGEWLLKVADKVERRATRVGDKVYTGTAYVMKDDGEFARMIDEQLGIIVEP